MKSLIIAFLIILASCTKMLDRSPHGAAIPAHDGFKEYLIEAGAHFTSDNGYKSISKKQAIHFKAWFDSSCIYTSSNPVNQGDINKLYGFGDCNAGHQETSARFGWNWNGKSFDVYAYCYVNATRNWKLLGSLAPLERAEMSITVTPGKYIFKLNDKTEFMERGCTSEQIEGYQLYPYFGGDEPAPHAMRIYIKEL